MDEEKKQKLYSSNVHRCLEIISSEIEKLTLESASYTLSFHKLNDDLDFIRKTLDRLEDRIDCLDSKDDPYPN